MENWLTLASSIYYKAFPGRRTAFLDQGPAQLHVVPLAHSPHTAAAIFHCKASHKWERDPHI